MQRNDSSNVTLIACASCATCFVGGMLYGHKTDDAPQVAVIYEIPLSSQYREAIQTPVRKGKGKVPRGKASSISLSPDNDTSEPSGYQLLEKSLSNFGRVITVGEQPRNPPRSASSEGVDKHSYLRNGRDGGAMDLFSQVRVHLQLSHRFNEDEAKER